MCFQMNQSRVVYCNYQKYYNFINLYIHFKIPKREQSLNMSSLLGLARRRKRREKEHEHVAYCVSLYKIKNFKSSYMYRWENKESTINQCTWRVVYST